MDLSSVTFLALHVFLSSPELFSLTTTTCQALNVGVGYPTDRMIMFAVIKTLHKMTVKSNTKRGASACRAANVVSGWHEDMKCQEISEHLTVRMNSGGRLSVKYLSTISYFYKMRSAYCRAVRVINHVFS